MRTVIACVALAVFISIAAIPSPASATFVDVLPDDVFFDWIYALSEAGITTGCSLNPPLYCQTAGVTRAQMAVFLLRGLFGATFDPPPATGTVFADVLIDHPFAKWIERLFAQGITSGCDTSPLRYCPDAVVTREQMAVFLLRAKHGAGFDPEDATGIFDDVAAGASFADWIEQLAEEGITGGCSVTPPLYCPKAIVTREQMAVFLVRTFGLPMIPNWLAQVNIWRARAGLPGLSENVAWSQGDALHARYSVKHDVLEHDENPASPWFTPEGQAAAVNSAGAGNPSPLAPDSYAIESWLQAPFHAIGIIDPKLQQSGYGSYREADGGSLQMSGWLDTNRGLGPASGQPLPILFPADGATIPIPNRDLCPAGAACHWGETPSPLTECPGYVAPAGLPLILQFSLNTNPVVTASSLLRDGVSLLEHCVFTGATYSNPDALLQDIARVILTSRGGVVLIPRQPLPAGSSYTASVTANGQMHQWDFAIATPPAPDAGIADAPIPDWATTAIPPSFGPPRAK